MSDNVRPLVPKGYRAIAVRDDIKGKCVISYNQDNKKYYFVVNGVVGGPITSKDMSQLMENLQDVLSMKGQFHYIEGYDAAGNTTYNQT